MVVLVDLTQGVADLEVGLIVGHPVLLAAVDGDAAVRALKVDVGRGQLLCGGLGGVAALREARGPVVGTGAVGVLAYEGGALTYLGNGRVGVGVEEVVFGKDLLRWRRCRVAVVLEAEGSRSLRKA